MIRRTLGRGRLENMKPRTDAIRGPGFWNLDSSLMKDFHVTEGRYVEFRWEVFNTLNHQNLGLPNTTFCLPPNPDRLDRLGASIGLHVRQNNRRLDRSAEHDVRSEICLVIGGEKSTIHRRNLCCR